MSDERRRLSSQHHRLAETLVRLNVGGQLVCTTRLTLQKDPASMLARLVQPGNGDAQNASVFYDDESGEIFIVSIFGRRFGVYCDLLLKFDFSRRIIKDMSHVL